MIQLIAEYFKTQPVLKAWLFGSYSRGEETDTSDIDILIVLDDSQHVGLKFFGMYEDLKDLLGRNVDLVTDRSLAPFARESVDRDKILIYERAGAPGFFRGQQRCCVLHRHPSGRVISNLLCFVYIKKMCKAQRDANVSAPFGPFGFPKI